jgi:hypothetical protein
MTWKFIIKDKTIEISGDKNYKDFKKALERAGVKFTEVKIK